MIEILQGNEAVYSKFHKYVWNCFIQAVHSGMNKLHELYFRVYEDVVRLNILVFYVKDQHEKYTKIWSTFEIRLYCIKIWIQI